MDAIATGPLERFTIVDATTVLLLTTLLLQGLLAAASVLTQQSCWVVMLLVFGSDDFVVDVTDGGCSNGGVAVVGSIEDVVVVSGLVFGLSVVDSVGSFLAASILDLMVSTLPMLLVVLINGMSLM